MSNPLRTIPAVDTLLKDKAVQAAAAGIPGPERTYRIRKVLGEIRSELTKKRGEPLTYEEITGRIVQALRSCKARKFQEVINATGVLLHTNLGRAPLPQPALERLQVLGGTYFNLELDLKTGQRGSRYTNAAELFNLLNQDETGEKDTLIVNNNAAAVLVVLKALAAGGEVLVSRGQLVEIGGGFRIPEVIAASGSILKEVGTTNRTRLDDYLGAITPKTKGILLVHPSNYSIVGFTESVERQALAQLAQEQGLLLIEDLGSGAFPPFPGPSIPQALKASHVVTYSGDKLLGGPQAGIISGKKHLIDIIKKEPLLRAVRIDKLSLLALESVLELYLNQDYQKLPLWQLAKLDKKAIKERAQNWHAQIGPGLKGEVLPALSTMGGGSLPSETIPSWALVLSSPRLSAQGLFSWLRRSRPAVIGRISQERLWLDPRTVLEHQEKALLEILAQGVPPCS
ncbi:MAG: L-seryl-tRNA(Sec) selenium transferase [Firmicutes bacterium]|nr:L-seryl-tRNA(Sec) selenium transferase [Bacillota bacterium]